MAPLSQLKLYSDPRSRGAIVEWYLKEIGVQHETVSVDLATGANKADWFISKVNPLGKVPALQDGDLTLCQSGAILLYIADKYDTRVKTPKDRALGAQWVLFASTDMVELVFKKNLPEGSVEKLLDYLEARLAAQSFVEGDEFSVADVAVTSYLMFFKVFLPQVDLEKWSSLAAYLKRMSARPACKATMVKAINIHLNKK